MARIIKRGKTPKPAAHYECSECGTIAEYTPADIQPDLRDGAYVECPVCHTFIAKAVLFKDVK